jgi:hypothetical protein
MNDADRFRLLGTYRTPRFRYGQKVRCEVRGEVTVVGLTDGPIPWPIGKRGRARSLVVYKGLARAVRRESKVAVCYCWAITPQTVSKWRKTLGVGPLTPATRRRLRDNYFHDGHDAVMQERSRERMRDPEVLARWGAARRGKPLPRHVTEAAAAARRGTHHSAEARRRMSEALRQRWRRPPFCEQLWKEEEDELIRTLPPVEAAQHTGSEPEGGLHAAARPAPAGRPGGRAGPAAGEGTEVNPRPRRPEPTDDFSPGRIEAGPGGCGPYAATDGTHWPGSGAAGCP